MELEYKNGVRLTKLYHEMSPLEVAIHNYEEMAKKHYSDKNAPLTKGQEKDN